MGLDRLGCTATGNSDPSLNPACGLRPIYLKGVSETSALGVFEQKRVLTLLMWGLNQRWHFRCNLASLHPCSVSTFESLDLASLHPCKAVCTPKGNLPAFKGCWKKFDIFSVVAYTL